VVAESGVGFDISSVFNSTTNTAFASFAVNGNYSLFSVSLTTGAATAVGTIGTGATAILDIALPICAQITIGVCEPFLSVPVYGLTNTNTLVNFMSSDTGTILQTTSLTPLAVGENLIGMDFRPFNGLLYTMSNLNNLYTVNVQSGALTLVNQTSLPLNGTSFGFDFNPTADRLRIISDSGQNLRIVPDSGFVMADLNINGATVTSAAYTNNVAGSPVTSLYTLSAMNLYMQNPPNNGTQVLVGPLFVMTNITTGFDIFTSNNLNYGFISAPIQGAFRLLTVNLATGESFIRGIIGQTPLAILDIAIPIPGLPITASSTQQSSQVATNTQSQSQSAPIPPATVPIASAGKNSFVFLFLLVVLWITV
jgi:hypothetical protein